MHNSKIQFFILITMILGLVGCVQLPQPSLSLEGLNSASMGFKNDSPVAVIVGYRSASNSGRNVAVALVDSNTLELLKIYTLPVTIAWDSNPNVSPDGNYFVVRPSDHSNLGAWRVNDGIKVVTLENAGYGGLRWAGGDVVIAGDTMYRLTDGKAAGKIQSPIQVSYSP